ncbi:ankyrin repeat-containing domain protein [Echria macrotheca]|uniref:Ankyrin repeat-containing domain protein n=1 Tax=Echria macrotheca TaxID=438768 RepID=A0AAJ0BEG4_9PEZI|nr:ankyrin repeat-containing domain protein [Echria macrotheca]
MSHVDPRTQSPLRPGKSIFGKRPLGCQPNCACCCHSATRMSCRLVAFHMLIGSIRVWYRKQSNQRCTSADCQGTSASQDIRVDYRLPDWLTRATLSMLFSSNVNGNPEAVLRVVNILPETAVHPGSIFGMILSKDNEGIKDLIRRRECSIHDCVGQVVLSPLRLAARLNRYDIVRTLLMAGADPHQTEGASFTMSVASIIVDRFIQGRPKDLEACSQFPIYTYLEDFEFTPLHKLVMTGSHQDLAEALSKPMYLADINRRTLNGRTPLDVAAFRDDPDACELLIRAGADVNLDGCPTALYKACNLDHYHTVERLLTHGASVTAADKNGDCAILHHAQSAKTNFGARTMELLLRHGARVDATRRDGQQPLQQLGTWGDIVLDRINFLLDHGADVNHQDNLGETALLTAIKSFQEVAMALLLERGADPRLASYEGHTVLHKVGIHWNESILIDVLKMKPGLFRSVDVTAKDKSGKTALELFNGRKPPPNAKLRELFARFLTVACQACDDASSSDEDEFVDAQETAT